MAKGQSVSLMPIHRPRQAKDEAPQVGDKRKPTIGDDDDDRGRGGEMSKEGGAPPLSAAEKAQRQEAEALRQGATQVGGGGPDPCLSSMSRMLKE